MKRSLKIFIIGILLILMTGGIWFIFNNDNYRKKDQGLDGVSMSIKNGTLTNTGATIILKNDSNVGVFYGETYSIEIKKDDKWEKIETDLAFNLPAYHLSIGSSKEIEINWEVGYGKLEKGEYRIVKDFFYRKGEANIDFSVNAEFVIE